MKNAVNFGIFLFIFCLLAATFWILFVPKNTITQTLREKLSQQQERPDITFSGVAFAEIVAGVRYWEIRAVSSSLNKAAARADLFNLHGIFFENNLPVLGIEAPRAKWNMAAKEIEIEKPLGMSIKTLEPKRIVFKSVGEGGFSFVSQILHWDLKDKKIICREGVILKTKGAKITGKSLIADVNLKKARLGGDPVAELKDQIFITSKEFILDKSEQSITTAGKIELKQNDLNIKAAAGRYLPEENLVIFTGEARAVKPEISISGDRISFLTAEKSIQVEGRADLKYKDLLAKADRVIYREPQGLIEFFGTVKAKRGTDVLSGDYAAINLKTGKINVRGKTKFRLDPEE